MGVVKADNMRHSHNILRTIIAGMCLAAIAMTAIAAPKVRLGTVYRIAEQDMLDELQSKLKSMEKDGTLQKLQEQAVSSSIRSINRPAGASLPRAVHARQWVHDPTYVVPADIADHQGRVFAYAGDRINPLERGVGLRQPLLFVNTDDPIQLKALPNLVEQLKSPKVILVAGDWQAASKLLAKQVFFDQRGTLVKTFGISALPALVRQAGLTLQLDELVLKED
jgi:conjugal transfer pilus assembly protein TraW